MKSHSIHRLIGLCISFGLLLLFLTLWISGGDPPRNTDYLIWTVFSFAGVLIALNVFMASLKDPPPKMDWALWAIPLPFQVAGIISAFV